MKSKLLVVLSLFCMTQVQAAYIGSYVGYRQDHVDWNVAGGGVDVLSELTWRGLDIIEFGVVGERRWREWLLNGRVSWGPIVSGEAQDSDFLESGRRSEFSRSFCKVDGYVVDADASIGAFWRPHWLRCGYGVIRIGLSYHRQQTRDFAGRQTIIPVSDEGELVGGCGCDFPFFDQGTACTYRNDWYSSFVSLTIRQRVKDRFWWEADGSVHTGIFVGLGRWVLRQDLSHFYDIAPASGIEGRLLGGMCIGGGVRPFVGVKGQYWSTEKGLSVIFNDTEHVGNQLFNGATWYTWSLFAGLKVDF